MYVFASCFELDKDDRYLKNKISRYIFNLPAISAHYKKTLTCNKYHKNNISLAMNFQQILKLTRFTKYAYLI